jgi:hypothetical protein
LATHTRYPEIKKWAQSTGRRSIQLWMPKDTVQVLDRLCRERGMRRAELLDSLINEASGESSVAREAERTQGLQPSRPAKKSTAAGMAM